VRAGPALRGWGGHLLLGRLRARRLRRPNAHRRARGRIVGAGPRGRGLRRVGWTAQLPRAVSHCRHDPVLHAGADVAVRRIPDHWVNHVDTRPAVEWFAAKG